MWTLYFESDNKKQPEIMSQLIIKIGNTHLVTSTSVDDWAGWSRGIRSCIDD